MKGQVRGGVMPVADAAELIEQGLSLTIAGDEALLVQLPRGLWIGGTTPYFMTDEGGQCSRDSVFVQCLGTENACVTSYSKDTLAHILEDAPENGYSIIILPAASEVLEVYAHHAPYFPDMFIKPIVGWVSGVHLSELGQRSAAVLDGQNRELHTDRAVVLHVRLPENRSAVVHTVNLFEAGSGPELTFETTGDYPGNCYIDGVAGNLAEAIVAREISAEQPLIADYCGAMVNVSIQSKDETHGRVRLYAPVFKDVRYRFARPVEDYAAKFMAAMPEHPDNLVFGCNCILNYLYSDLEGKKTGQLTGPITFGEVAYQLLNQTAVFLTVEYGD